VTPAEELRAAATKLRAMAAKTTKPRKPEYGWDFLDRDELRDPSYTDVVCSQNGGVAAVASFVDWPDAAWIVLMGPDKAEVLAAWLDAEAACQEALAADLESQTLARVLDAIAGRETGVELTTSYDVGPQALAFARALLKEDS
jgi:hypothetical protein